MVNFTFVIISIAKSFPSGTNQKTKFEAIHLNEMLTFTIFYTLTTFNMSFWGWERNPQPVFPTGTSSKKQKISLISFAILVMDLFLHC